MRTHLNRRTPALSRNASLAVLSRWQAVWKGVASGERQAVEVGGAGAGAGPALWVVGCRGLTARWEERYRYWELGTGNWVLGTGWVQCTVYSVYRCCTGWLPWLHFALVLVGIPYPSVVVRIPAHCWHCVFRASWNENGTLVFSCHAFVFDTGIPLHPCLFCVVDDDSFSLENGIAIWSCHFVQAECIMHNYRKKSKIVA